MVVTVGAVLGVKSLGLLFTDGFQRGITAEVMTGIVMTVVLALAIDGTIVLLGRMLMPWSRKTKVRPAARPARSADRRAVTA